MTDQAAVAPSSLLKRMKDPFSGLSHAAAFCIAALGAGLFTFLPHQNAATTATLLVYALTLLMLYAASATYHLVKASDRLALWLRRMDHSAIFLFIAGSCTPLFYQAFEGNQRIWMLVLIWSVAVMGVASKILWLGAPRWLYTAMYIAMGWTVLLQGKSFVAGIDANVFSLVLAGGVTYTAGAIIYVLKRPNLFKGRLGFHDIWHLFVMAGSALHYAAIYLAVSN